ncbi:MAG: oxygen-independent coproporphyrinogen III oxidase [Opitutae bacterium]|jgi:oxygen-independent coproporphyrinogen III oxidase|nr:oxygen-independent coproporphyrinogen III oxidase [Opitutae bacterium]
MNTKDLLIKYSNPAPRYVAYPSPNIWKNQPPTGERLRRVKKIHNHSKSIDLYVHIPFCSKLCWYCGCKTEIRPEKEYYGDNFLESLEKEIKQVNFDGKIRPKVASLHLGGGTPTYLSENQLSRLMVLINRAFLIQPKAVLSVESNPETVNVAKLKTLWENGFSRVSFGIQDFNQETQWAINREHSYKDVKNLILSCRKIGYQSVNLDLVYGLPHQDQKSFLKSIEKVISLNPERVALYNFAYLPKMIPHQQLINPKSLPCSEENCQIFLQSCNLFKQHGFVHVGMDHFVKQGDSLAKSFTNGTLHRNFMGYVSNPSENLLGLGPGAISYLNHAYMRNQPSSTLWNHQLKQEKSGQDLWYKQTLSDQKTQNLINQILCHMCIKEDQITEEFTGNLETLREKLVQFEKDQILIWDGTNKQWNITPKGKMFSRFVAQAIDQHWENTRSNEEYSKVA